MARIVAVGLIGTILTLLIRPHRPDIAMLCAMATGAIILFSVLDIAMSTIEFLKSVSEKYAIDTALFSTMLKVTGIAYLAEFVVQACKDAGEGGIAAKIELGAKVLILGLCAPLIMNLLRLLTEVLP
jgi:stage III sporulation protein AD